MLLAVYLSVCPGPLSSTSGLFMQLLTVYCLWDVPEAPLSTNITAPQACCTPPAPRQHGIPSRPSLQVRNQHVALAPFLPTTRPNPSHPISQPVDSTPNGHMGF